MDIFKFHNPTSATKFEQGEIIEDLKTKMWVERYAKEGEFRLTALATNEMKLKLPIGCFISHLNTAEVMQVENHEISETKDQESTLIITGRSFETVLENRVVGSDRSFPIAYPDGTGKIGIYLIANPSIVQIIELINTYIDDGYLTDDNLEIPYVTATDIVPPGVFVSEFRGIQKGNLYEKVIELLDIDTLGIKTVRPGPSWYASRPFVPTDHIAITIYKGSDKTKEVVFSYDTGEIVSAEYLWSNRKAKNAILVSGKWVEAVVLPAAIKYARKMIYVDASDIDQDFTSMPTGGDYTQIVAQMQQRGRLILAGLKDIAITKAEVSKESTKSIYRRDFDVGDLITVLGDYNEVTKMRVSEFVEIEDETGEIGYPTLTFD